MPVEQTDGWRIHDLIDMSKLQSFDVNEGWISNPTRYKAFSKLARMCGVALTFGACRKRGVFLRRTASFVHACAARLCWIHCQSGDLGCPHVEWGGRG